MSNLRRRFTVGWADLEPVTVVTSARDVAAISPYLPKTIDADGNTVIDEDRAGTDPHAMWRMVHAALIRTGHDECPTDYDEFIDQLDECEPRDAAPVSPPVPTMPAASETPP